MNSNYLVEAVDKLLIYKTPKEIEQYILKQIIIANPPYFQKKE
jgi:tRNA1(Val) A37 N6-methylase TrmN6